MTCLFLCLFIIIIFNELLLVTCKTKNIRSEEEKNAENFAENDSPGFAESCEITIEIFMCGNMEQSAFLLEEVTRQIYKLRATRAVRRPSAGLEAMRILVMRFTPQRGQRWTLFTV